MQYNKVYFLHVPKTGGRFFKNYILDQIVGTLNKNNIEVLYPPSTVDKHGGWHKDIDNQTYVISLFREPVSFFVSVVAHMAAGENDLINNEEDFIIKAGSAPLDIDKDFLFNKLETTQYLKNFQSKNFILCPQTFPIVTEARRMYKTNKELDIELAYNRINRTNLLIKSNDLKILDSDKLTNKILTDLGIKENIKIKLPNREHYKNPFSKILLDKLDSKDIEIISNNFLFDKEIYENESLFWNFRD